MNKRCYIKTPNLRGCFLEINIEMGIIQFVLIFESSEKVMEVLLEDKICKEVVTSTRKPRYSIKRHIMWAENLVFSLEIYQI